MKLLASADSTTPGDHLLAYRIHGGAIWFIISYATETRSTVDFNISLSEYRAASVAERVLLEMDTLIEWGVVDEPGLCFVHGDSESVCIRIGPEPAALTLTTEAARAFFKNLLEATTGGDSGEGR